MQNLPQSVRDIIELVGMAPALALVRAFPGNILKVPTGAREEGQVRNRLIGIMGFEAAETFMRVYGGERLAIPRCKAALTDERDRKIIADYDAGRSVPWLAVEYCLTERQIRTILKRVPGEGVGGLGRMQTVDDKQMGLF